MSLRARGDRSLRGGRGRGGRGDHGASSIELVMYMPLMFFAIFATVQFGLMYLGNQAASAAARETARVARVNGGAGAAEGAAIQRGSDYLRTVGKGVIENWEVSVEPAGTAAEPEVIAVVEGDALKVVPGLPAPRIRQVVQGPVEQFRVDDDAP